MSQDLLPYLPFDGDANDAPAAAVLGAPPFAYLGTPLSLADFDAYLAGFHFGPHPPTHLILHHTANPSTTWAPAPKTRVWDEGETGLGRGQIAAKRTRQLDAIRDYYISLGWDAGPHLFLDDLFVWLFTPMNRPGIHARGGNGTPSSYSIGIEVLGNYQTVRWPAYIERNVRHVVRALQRRLGTFDLIHRAGPGGISSHRDWGKPACPGDAIRDAYYLAVVRASDPPDPAPPTPPEPPHPPIDPAFRPAWIASGGLWQPSRLTPGYPTAPATRRSDGLLYQRFERGVARKTADGRVEWLLLDEIARW